MCETGMTIANSHGHVYSLFCTADSVGSKNGWTWSAQTGTEVFCQTDWPIFQAPQWAIVSSPLWEPVGPGTCHVGHPPTPRNPRRRALSIWRCLSDMRARWLMGVSRRHSRTPRTAWRSNGESRQECYAPPATPWPSRWLDSAQITSRFIPARPLPDSKWPLHALSLSLTT